MQTPRLGVCIFGWSSPVHNCQTLKISWLRWSNTICRHQIRSDERYRRCLIKLLSKDTSWQWWRKGSLVYLCFQHLFMWRIRGAAFEGGFFERGIVYEPKQTLMMAMTIVLITAMMIVLMIIIVMMIDVKIMKNIIINQNKLPFLKLHIFSWQRCSSWFWSCLDFAGFPTMLTSSTHITMW